MAIEALRTRSALFAPLKPLDALIKSAAEIGSRYRFPQQF
jgi:hypothetical protein